MYKTLASNLSKEDLSVTPAQRTERIFENIDANNDNKLTLDEFLNGANMDPVLVKMFRQNKF